MKKRENRATDDRKAPDPKGRRERPGRFRRWALRPLVWTLVVLLVLLTGLWFFLQSAYLSRRLGGELQARLSEALGRPVGIGAVELDLMPFAVEVRDVLLPGPGAGDPPVLEASRLRVELALGDLRRRVVRLRQVDVERPRVVLLFDEEGRSNLPELPRGEGGEPSFEVQIDRLLLREGRLRLEELQVPLEVDGRGLWGRLSGGTTAEAADRYRIALSGEEVTTRLPAGEPYPVALALQAVLSADGLEIVQSRLAGSELRGEVSGRIGWGEGGGTGDLEVEAGGDAALANRLGYLDEPIAGPLGFRGAVHWGDDGWGWGGAVSAVRIDFLGRRFEAVEGRVDGDAAAVEAEVTAARHARGSLTGKFHLALEDDRRGGNAARVDLRGADLSLRRLLDDLGLPLEGLGGGVGGDLTYRFSTAAPLEGDGEGRLRLAGLRRQTDVLSLAGTVPVAVTNGRIAVAGARLESADRHQSLLVDVEASLTELRGKAWVTLQTADIGDLAVLLPAELRTSPAAGEADTAGGAESTATEGGPPFWLPADGAGTLRATLAFSPSGSLSDLTFDLTAVAAPALEVDRLEGSFRLIAEPIEDLRLEDLRVAAFRGGGELRLTGAVDLASGQAAAAPVFSLEAGLAGWPAESLAYWLPADGAPGGRLDGTVEIGGTWETPTVAAHLEGESLIVGGLAADRGEATFSLAGSRLDLERLDLAWPMGVVTVTGAVDLTEASLDLSLEAADLDLGGEPLAAWVAGDLGGRLTATASLGGTLEDPLAEIELEGRQLVLAGRPLGDAGRAGISASWRDGRFRADGSALGLLPFEGGGRLDRDGIDLVFDVHSEEVRRILALLVEEDRAPEIDGAFSGTLAVAGGFGTPEGIVTRLELRRVELGYQGKRIENLIPVKVRAEAAGLTLESLFLGETGSDNELFVAGFAGFEAGMPLDLKLQGSLDATWFQPFLSGMRVGGVFDLLATVKGTLSQPRFNGQGEVRDGRALIENFPHAVERVAATVLFYPDRIVLDNGSATCANGRLRAAGSLVPPFGDRSFGYQVQVRGEGLTLRYPEGWILRGGAELNVVAPAAGGDREIRGVVDLERAIYAEDVPLGLPQLLQGAFERQRVAIRESDELLSGTLLSLSVRGDDALRVRNNVAHLSGDIDLTIWGSLARPAVFGKVEIEPGGTLLFRDADYEVERGLLTFSNPAAIDPVIDLVATTKIKSFDIQLMLSGTLDRLEANFVSDPPLADLEVLSLLATGSTPSDLEAGGNLAESFLYGQAASVISRRVNTLFGFDRFRLQPGAATNEVSGGIGFVAEKQLSRDVTVIFSRDPSSPEREILQVEWNVGAGVTLIATGEGDSSYALDVRWEKSF